jgi:ABC-type sugar transport system substrate-binding protein
MGSKPDGPGRPRMTRRPNWLAARSALCLTSLGLTGALVLLTAAACSSSSSSTAASGPASSASSSSGASSSCGTIPSKGYSDADGLVKALGGSYAADYNGYSGTVQKSAWANWKPKISGQVKVGISISQLVNPYQTELLDSLESDLKAAGYQVIPLISSEEVTNQIQQFQTLIEDKVNLIIYQPLSGPAFTSVVNKAAAAGIPSVSVLNNVVDPNTVNLVPNSFIGGAELGQFLVKEDGGKGFILGLHGILGVPIDTETMDGANAVFALCPGITTNESIATQFSPATAKTDVLQFLNTHPGAVSGVMTTGPFTTGVISAFEQAGRTVPTITDNGLDEGSLAYWNEHKSTYKGVGLDNPATGLAAAAVRVTQDMLAGDGIKLSDIVIAPPLVTSANLSQFVNPSWTFNSPGTANGPNDAYFTDSYIDGFFGK